MSGADVDVAVRLGLQDQATPGIDRAAQRAAAFAKKTTSEVEAGNNRQRSSYEKTSYAREMLGVRSEQRIQREIQQTEAAYERLMRIGKLSAAEQARAFDATRARVTALTNEMGKLTKAQEQTARGAKALQMGGIVAAGGAAVAYTLTSPINHAMSVDERLRDLVNMGYRGRGADAKRAGMTTLRDAVDGSVASYGGNRQHATDALSSLMENGVAVDDAVKTLPTLMKFATASSADPTQLAQIAMRAMQNFKIDAKDIPSILNMALAAGSAGGFELKDMAKWLPEQMGLAAGAGMKGKKDFSYLLALNQAAVTTAGTKDGAGNNVVNLIGKVMSADTANDVKKLGIDHYAYLQKQREKGMNPMEAFTALVDTTVGRRADYQSIKKKLETTKDEGERKEMLESMATIAQGAGIGKLIQDRQALGALLASLQQRGLIDRVRSEVAENDRNDGGIGQEFYDFKAEGGAHKANKRAQNMESARDRAIGDGGSVLSAANDAIASMAQKFPELTGGASLAATALVAAAGGAGVFAMATGGGAVGGAITRTAGKYLPAGKTLLRGGALGVGAMVGSAGLNAAFGDESAISRYGSSTLNGAATGALIGSIVPVLGTAIGAAVGGGLGFGWEGIKDMLKPSTEAPKMAADIKLSVSDERVRVTSSNVTATGMTSSVQTDTGNLWAMP